MSDCKHIDTHTNTPRQRQRQTHTKTNTHKDRNAKKTQETQKDTDTDRKAKQYSKQNPNQYHPSLDTMIPPGVPPSPRPTGPTPRHFHQLRFGRAASARRPRSQDGVQLQRAAPTFHAPVLAARGLLAMLRPTQCRSCPGSKRDCPSSPSARTPVPRHSPRGLLVRPCPKRRAASPSESRQGSSPAASTLEREKEKPEHKNKTKVSPVGYGGKKAKRQNKYLVQVLYNFGAREERTSAAVADAILVLNDGDRRE